MFRDQSWKPIYFGVRRLKVKVTKHKVCVSLCCLLLAAYISYDGFFPTAMPYLTSHARDSGFPFVTSPWLLLQPTSGFSMYGVFCSQPVANKHCRRGRGTLVSALFFSLMSLLFAESDEYVVVAG